MPHSTLIYRIGSYTQKRQATSVAKGACWTIYELCTGAERIPGASRYIRWWYQNVGREIL